MLRMTVLAVALPMLCLAQPGPDDSVESLVKKLGSADVRQREFAGKMLLTRPESEPALRQALQSKDLEVVRRAQRILVQFNLMKLDGALTEGRVDRLIDVLNSLPEGSHDAAIWVAISKFGQKVFEINKKESRFPDKILIDWTGTPVGLKAKQITGWTDAPYDRYLLRTEEVNFDYTIIPKDKRRNYSLVSGPVIICSGTVRSVSEMQGAVILARGPIEIGNSTGSLIVCAGDVTINGTTAGSLVIAGGIVQCKSMLFASRIISGGSVVCSEKNKNGNPITENEKHPLGYIRWSDKSKGAPKKK